MNDWDRRLESITRENWLRQHPGATIEDYERHRTEERVRAEQRERQQLEKRADQIIYQILRVLHFLFYYVALPLVGAFALGLIWPSIHFWPSAVGVAFLIFILRKATQR